jgi:glycosyltransferase involved in cell wall biosynthesis
VSEARPRRINAAGPQLERPDLLIHALAQLPENVTLELSNQLPDRARLELLARAYGISNRVTFDGASQPVGPLQTPQTMAALIQALSDPSDPPAACRGDDGLLAGHRVAIVTNLPAPYRLPLFTTISRLLTRGGAELRVFFMGTKARGRAWINPGPETNFQSEWLSSVELPLKGRPPVFPINLESRLSAFRPTVILAGSLSPVVAGRAALQARRSGVVFGIWSGEIAGRSTSSGRMRRVQRKRLARHSDFAIAYGFLAGEYLRGLNPSLPFVYGRNTSNAYALEEPRRAAGGEVWLVAVADMAKPGKGIGLLVDALAAVPRLACSLIVVGSGAEASGLEARARSDERIQFVGALPQIEVRRRYAEADVFLFPSTAEADPFGLALVEAMGSGLASVASIGPGVLADLAVDDWNCLVVRERTAEAWARALERVVSDPDLRLSLGENAARTIRNRWTVDHACDSMIAGLRLGLLVAGNKAPRSVAGTQKKSGAG